MNPNHWDEKIAKNNFIPAPFSYRVSSLVKSEYLLEIENLPGFIKGAIIHGAYPEDETPAIAAHINYLKGTTDNLREWRYEVQVKEKFGFQDLLQAYSSGHQLPHRNRPSRSEYATTYARLAHCGGS